MKRLCSLVPPRATLFYPISILNSHVSLLLWFKFNCGWIRRCLGLVCLDKLGEEIVWFPEPTVFSHVTDCSHWSILFSVNFCYIKNGRIKLAMSTHVRSQVLLTRDVPGQQYTAVSVGRAWDTMATLLTSVLTRKGPQMQLLCGYTPVVQSFCVSLPSLQPRNQPNRQNRNVTNDPCHMSHINYLYGRAC